jgi:hypothetical protein
MIYSAVNPDRNEIDKKFLKELITNFPLIRHGPHRKLCGQLLETVLSSRSDQEFEGGRTRAHTHTDIKVIS